LNFIDDSQPHCVCAATIFPSHSSTTEQRSAQQRNEHRVTTSSASSASSASSSVVADDEQEQTSAQPVAPVIVERITVSILLYIDDVLVIYSVEQLP